MSEDAGTSGCQHANHYIFFKAAYKVAAWFVVSLDVMYLANP